MAIRSAVILILPFLLVISCGSDIRIKKGDRFEVLTDLREVAEIQGGIEFEDGFVCSIPKGTILEALYNYSMNSNFFECRVIKVNGNADEDYIIETLAPEGIRKREGFESFSITINADYIGSKIKKLNK